MEANSLPGIVSVVADNGCRHTGDWVSWPSSGRSPAERCNPGSMSRPQTSEDTFTKFNIPINANFNQKF